MPISHCSQRQDKTVLSCLCWRCELNWWQNKTVFSSTQYTWDWTVANWKLCQDKTKLSLHRISRQDKTVLLPIQFTLPTWTSQDSFVLFVSAVWNRHYSVLRTIIISIIINTKYVNSHDRISYDISNIQEKVVANCELVYGDCCPCNGHYTRIVFNHFAIRFVRLLYFCCMFRFSQMCIFLFFLFLHILHLPVCMTNKHHHYLYMSSSAHETDGL